MLSLNFLSLDFVVVIFYLLIITWVGIRQSRKIRNIQMFATGSCNFSTPVIVTAAFVTLVDGNDTIGLAANVYSEGLLFAMVCLGPVMSLVLVAFVIAPKMRPFTGLISSGDILEKLYGRHAKILGGFGVVVEATILTAGQVMAIGYVMSLFFSFRNDLAIIIGGGIVLLYSARGGVMSVVKTDIIQFWALIVPIPIICGIALASSGGLEHVFDRVPSSHLSLSMDSDGFWRHIAMCISLGLPALYPGAMQRILMAKNASQIRTVFSVTAVISLIFYGVVILIGFIALAENISADPNLAFTGIINRFLPTGVKGLAIACLLAVITSTVGSHLNMAAVSLVNDVIAPFRKTAMTDRQFITVSRISCVCVGIVATFTAAYFENILDTIFWVIFWGNPLFLPGMFFGIMGFRAGTRAFWTGLGCAACITLGYTVIVGEPDFFSSLLGTFVNSIVLLSQCFLQRRRVNPKTPRAFEFKPKIQELIGWAKTNLRTNERRRESYRTILLAFFAGSSLAPFFFWSALDASLGYLLYFALCIAVASCSFLIFFDDNTDVAFDINASVFFVAQMSFAVAQCFSNPLWLLSVCLLGALAVVIFQGANLRLIFCALASLIGANVLANASVLPISHALVFWAVVVQVLSSAFCLFFVWKKEAELARRLDENSENVAHTFETLLSEFLLEAQTLRWSMPVLLTSYQTALQSNPTIGEISRKRLLFLDSIPEKMERNTLRLQTNVHMMLGKNGFADKALVTESVLVSKSVSSVLSVFHRPVNWSPAGEVYFLGNTNLFELALLEILKNASEAINLANRGMISINLDEKARELSIEDTASGVPPFNIDKIFNRRFTTKATGTGLGLYFCKTLFAGWGGDIRCESEESNFTRFIISLPEPSRPEHNNA